MDVARRKKFKVFVPIVDFSPPYDCVSRISVFTCFKHIGCGTTMLLAFAAKYKYTNSVIGSASIATTAGIRRSLSYM